MSATESIQQEIQHLANLREKARASSNDQARGAEMRSWSDGATSAYDVALSALKRLQETISKGGAA